MFSPESFKLWQELLVNLTGVYIPYEKRHLFENRLNALMKSNGFSDFHVFYQTLDDHPENPLIHDIIELMTTHETSFYRDRPIFGLFQTLVSRYIKDWKEEEGPRPLRVLSAACSTGQEPYTIAMALNRILSGKPWIKLVIVGGDIARHSLAFAEKACYSAQQVRTLTPLELEQFFTEENNGWRFKDELKGLVNFQELNLVELEQLNTCFDFIFCRNVGIYFQTKLRGQIFDQLATKINVGGGLFLGGSESLHGVCSSFERRSHLGVFYYEPIPVVEPVELEEPQYIGCSAETNSEGEPSYVKG